jgi:hypothetical protein
VDNTGEEFYSTLYAIRESPLEPGVIWTGANDGPFHVTRNHGVSWTKITPPGLPQGCRVSMIDPSPHRRGSAYYAVYCYLLGDFAPYAYRTDDYGRTWTRLTTGSNGIPADYPVRVVREDRSRAGLLYAGTEFGMFVSFDNGARWQRFNMNLPVVPINDIKVHQKDVVIATQGRGFWILDNVTPLHARGALAATAGKAQLFTPRTAYRIRYGTGRGRLGSAAPQYPAPGAQIDYWLPAGFAGDLRLEILDATGKVVQQFASAAQGQQRPAGDVAPTDPDEDMRPRGGGAGARLTRNAGLNRFTWDLRYPGPWNPATRSASAGGGPTAVPGAYRARLVAGDVTVERPFTVAIDPRNAKDGVTVADLAEQHAVGMRVRDMVSEVTQLVGRVRDAKRRFANASGAAADTLRLVEALEAKLVTPPVRYSKPELQAHISYLYGLTNQADQKIGRDVIERAAALRKELDAAQAEARRILGAP